MLPIAQLKTIEILDLLEQAWKTMDGGLKKALHLDTDDGIFKAAMAEVRDQSFNWQLLLISCSGTGVATMATRLRSIKEPC